MEGNPRDGWRRKRFKENLDRLLTSRGLTRKAASDRAGVPYDWLRRAVSRGIAWPDKRSKDWLKKLADELGLDDVERLWSANFHEPPGRSSIKDEAARIAEVMREFVMLVGPRHPKLTAILGQMGGTRLSLSLKQAEEEAKARPAQLVSVDDLLAGMRRTNSPETIARQALDLWGRTLDDYKKCGLPLLDYVVLDWSVILDHAEVLQLDTPEELCRYIGRVYWLGQYAVLLGKTPAETIEFIEGKNGVMPPGPSSIKDGQKRPSIDESYSMVARQTIDLLSPHLLRFKANGLPMVEEVCLGVEVVTEQAQLHPWASPDELARHVYEMLWLPRYAGLLGKTVKEAKQYIKAHLAGQGGGNSQDGRAKAVEARPERVASVEEVQARATAKGLVGRVLGDLTPEQADHFLRGYPTAARARVYLEGELFERIRATVIAPPQPPDEAVRSVVAEIVGDYEKSRDDGDHGATYDPADEPESLAAPTESIESRHGDDVTEEEIDPGSLRSPVGVALEAEIAHPLADDREAAERHVDDLLAPLGDLPLPGGGGTYFSYVKRLGTPRAVATSALRACGGDVGKAQGCLIEKINKEIEAEKLRGSVAGRPETARAGGETSPQTDRTKKRKSSVKVRTEDIRESVLQSHRLGMAVGEIIVDLRNDGNLPDWVRKVKRPELKARIGRIINRYELAKEDNLAQDEFDARSQDDERNWEMDDE